jgi:cytochrome c biogenesis protein CcmG/thiol:disulfide interchange protein DsbE|tara:strand:+ start:770 stop:1252 length:483 start_codon:yes stop_codon:yes gene_type:complete
MYKYLFLALIAISSELYSQKVQTSLRLNRIDGKKVQLKKYLDSGPILVNFWATWCGPCKKEMIHLDRFSRQYKKNNFSVLSISIDTQRSLSEVKRYVRSKKYDFEVFIDPNQQIFKKLNGNIMPTNLLIDKNGQVVWMHYGYMPGDEVVMEQEISRLLEK